MARVSASDFSLELGFRLMLEWKIGLGARLKVRVNLRVRGWEWGDTKFKPMIRVDIKVRVRDHIRIRVQYGSKLN